VHRRKDEQVDDDATGWSRKMTVRVLAAHDRNPVPWKNGGGFTREIALHPPGANMDDFQWRVSTAEVAADGPFSRFEGVDRTLVILAGAGIDLAIGNAAPVRLGLGSEPLAFPADAPTVATLLTGPVTDLNVMVRRGLWSAEVDYVEIATKTQVICDTEVCLVLALGPLNLDGVVTLGVGDVVRLEPGDTPTLRPQAGAVSVVMIELSRVSGV
jgi:environmental stress-induced protein Ves